MMFTIKELDWYCRLHNIYIKVNHIGSSIGICFKNDDDYRCISGRPRV